MSRFDKARGHGRGESLACGWVNHTVLSQTQALKMTIYSEAAMRKSAARACLASSWEVAPARPALAATCPRLRCPVWFYASGKIPGSIWPVPVQQVYERISVPELNRGENQTACTPPWEGALYHLIPGQVSCDDSRFHFHWSVGELRRD